MVCDAVDHRRRFKENGIRLVGKLPHLIKIRDHFFEHAHGENVASRIGELAHERRRHELAEICHIQTPDHAVAVIAARVLRGEMRGDERRICPVEQAGRQTVVLRDRQQLPKPGILGQLRIAVLPKTAENLRFKR